MFAVNLLETAEDNEEESYVVSIHTLADRDIRRQFLKR